MSTPFRVPGLRIPGLIAGADLSANQYRFVKAGSAEGEVVAIAAATDRPVGVQLDKPTASKTVDVGSFEITEVIAGAAVALDAEVQTDAQGRAITAVATGYVVGRALTAASDAGDRISVALNCFNPPLKA
jgi:hypothetical protein